MLYTINNVYPNKDFAFSLSASDLGMAETEHLHVINDVPKLLKALNDKSTIVHTHSALPSLLIGESRMNGDLELTGEGAISVTLSGNKVIINTSPTSTGIIAAFKNVNPQRRHSMLKFYIGSEVSVTDDSEILNFTEEY